MLKKNRPLLQFVAIAVVLYLIWFIGYNLWLEPDGRLDQWLTGITASATSKILAVFGYQTSYAVFPSKSTIYIDGKHLLGIAHVCNGLVLYALFAGFLVSFPGSWQNKLWFIPVGMFLIYVVNVLRSVSLCLIKIHNPESLDFNHRYTFTLVMYSFIFLLWMLWVNKFSGVTSKKSTIVSDEPLKSV
jgi:exosortase family protein XrtF